MHYSVLTTQGGTLAGNAISCAASLATLQNLTPKLYQNVFARSTQLLKALHQLASKGSPVHHLIAHVRGLGLMVGIEFRAPDDPLTLEGVNDCPETHILLGKYGLGQKEVPRGIGRRVREKCWEKGVMVLTTSCFDTIRWVDEGAFPRPCMLSWQRPDRPSQLRDLVNIHILSSSPFLWFLSRIDHTV